MEVVRAAVGQVDFAVDNIGVGAGGGAVERPLELPEGQGQTSESDVAIGPRVAEAPGFGGEMGRHLGKKMRFIEAEGIAQLELEGAAGGFRGGQAKLEDGGGVAVKIGALGDGDENQAGLRGGRFERSGEGRFQFGGH